MISVHHLADIPRTNLLPKQRAAIEYDRRRETLAGETVNNTHGSMTVIVDEDVYTLRGAETVEEETCMRARTFGSGDTEEYLHEDISNYPGPTLVLAKSAEFPSPTASLRLDSDEGSVVGPGQEWGI
jgi:hypothetical protein